MSSAEYIVSEIKRHKKGATIMLAGLFHRGVGCDLRVKAASAGLN
jgi:hypothetical protein